MSLAKIIAFLVFFTKKETSTLNKLSECLFVFGMYTNHIQHVQIVSSPTVKSLTNFRVSDLAQVSFSAFTRSRIFYVDTCPVDYEYCWFFHTNSSARFVGNFVGYQIKHSDTKRM